MAFFLRKGALAYARMQEMAKIQGFWAIKKSRINEKKRLTLCAQAFITTLIRIPSLGFCKDEGGGAKGFFLNLSMTRDGGSGGAICEI